ncbi:hypothetical protein [Burkholderia sp. S171]|jgi:hypothetical protein|uniref:hypothetical protein n=1 Tax=Burkholderia sp. S171 TaxID=1641860 RepID=UPI00131D5B60|nr:hypothetical protein [Burkholderia sp. S171]
MNKATSTLIAAVAALTLSGGAYAQSNNSLARPSVTSPVSAGGGYGTPGTTNSDSGKAAGSSNSALPNSVNGSTPAPIVWPNNNSLARPSVTSPAAAQ